jgi:uncharacterized membrane protein
MSEFSTSGGRPRSITRCDWIALTLSAVFVLVFSWLTFRQYATFNSRAPDLAIFDQAIWNTLEGRFMYSSIIGRNIFTEHFSPYFTLLAPLFWLWPDGRILYIVQTVGIAVAGLLLYRIVRDKHPKIAPWFLLAFFLNPALHEVTLLELRRVTLAMPYLALAMLALYKKQRRLLLFGLVLALLCKENIGLLVAMVGIYLILFEKDWKYGLTLAIAGATWVIVAMVRIIPAFNTADDPSGYRLVSYFASYGDSLPSILTSMLQDPSALLLRIFDRKALQALWRISLPLGLVLPLLAPDWLLICLPSFVYMLASDHPGMHQLKDWYMASPLPILFAAIGVGFNRISVHRASWLVAVLLLCTGIAFPSFSQVPLGGQYDPSLYALTEHHHLAAEIVSAVPEEAHVAAQVSFLTHLAHHEHLYHYPWIPSLELENIDYYVLDRRSNAYPLQGEEINWEIDNLVADPSIVVEMEADGIYLLHQGADPLPSRQIGAEAEGAIRLDRFEVAISGDEGLFETVTDRAVNLRPGQEVRVTLYWQALAPPEAEYTVSVRLANASGELLAQHDMLPSKGARPTSWWETGWYFRDVYYLAVPPQATGGTGRLDLLLYNANTLERATFDGGKEILALADVQLTN